MDLWHQSKSCTATGGTRTPGLKGLVLSPLMLVFGSPYERQAVGPPVQRAEDREDAQEVHDSFEAHDVRQPYLMTRFSPRSRLVVRARHVSNGRSEWAKAPGHYCCRHCLSWLLLLWIGVRKSSQHERTRCIRCTLIIFDSDVSPTPMPQSTPDAHGPDRHGKA